MKRTVALLLLLMLCSGCTALPAEEKAFAVVLCVAKGGEAWQVQGRIPTYQSGGGYLTVTGRGPSVNAALADMEASAPMAIHLSQLRLVVLDAALGPTGELPEVLQALSRRADLRLQAAVAVTKAPADDLMKALEPSAGVRLSKAIDVLLESRSEQGVILPATLAEVIRMGERQSPVLLNLEMEEGEISLSGIWPMKAEGTLAPRLTPEETALLALLTGKVRAFQLPVDGEMLRVRDASADVRLSADMTCAAVELTLTAVDTPFTGEGLRHTLADALLSLLSRLYVQGCDVLGLGRQAIIHTHDMAQWHGMNWPEQLRQLRWNVSVGVTGPT